MAARKDKLSSAVTSAINVLVAFCSQFRRSSPTATDLYLNTKLMSVTTGAVSRGFKDLNPYRFIAMI